MSTAAAEIVVPPCPVQLDEKGEPFIPLPSFPGLRLTLWTAADADDMFTLYNNPAMEQWLYHREFPVSREYVEKSLIFPPERAAYLSLLTSSYPNAPPPIQIPFPFDALREVATGRVIGSLHCRLSTLHGEGEWELSYEMLTEWAGKGIGSEMIAKGLEFLRWAGVKKVLAFCQVINMPSRSVLARNGFKLYHEENTQWPASKGGGIRETLGFRIDW
ncbi:hypothetical protein IAT38_005247 [Cryptococcus sp. DSM 104549]